MPNNPPSNVTFMAPEPQTAFRLLQWYSNSAITTGVKKEWVSGSYYRIKDILIDSATGSVGNVPDIIDININGTSIFANEGASILGDGNEIDRRPFINPGDTGLWQDRGSIRPGYTGGSPNQPTVAPTVSGRVVIVPGDIVAVEVDQVAGTGSARVKVCIVLGDA